MEVQEGWSGRKQGEVEGRYPKGPDSQQCKNVTDTIGPEMRLITGPQSFHEAVRPLHPLHHSKPQTTCPLSGPARALTALFFSKVNQDIWPALDIEGGTTILKIGVFAESLCTEWWAPATKLLECKGPSSSLDPLGRSVQDTLENQTTDTQLLEYTGHSTLQGKLCGPVMPTGTGL